MGACIGAGLNGKLLDWSYRRAARAHGFPIDRKKGDDLRRFPIEHARLQSFFPIIAVGLAAFLPYGWTLHQRTHLAVPLVLQFFIGLSFIAANNSLSTLLVDLFPDRPATASAASNLVRCWLGAVGAAVIDYMLNAMGAGWCFTFWGLVLCLGVGVVVLEYRYGLRWRARRFLRLEEKRRKKQSHQLQEVQPQRSPSQRGQEDVEMSGVNRRDDKPESGFSGDERKA